MQSLDTIQANSSVVPVAEQKHTQLVNWQIKNCYSRKISRSRRFMVQDPTSMNYPQRWLRDKLQILKQKVSSPAE
jgi:hypothetical protein